MITDSDIQQSLEFVLKSKGVKISKVAKGKKFGLCFNASVGEITRVVDEVAERIARNCEKIGGLAVRGMVGTWRATFHKFVEFINMNSKYIFVKGGDGWWDKRKDEILKSYDHDESDWWSGFFQARNGISVGPLVFRDLAWIHSREESF